MMIGWILPIGSIALMIYRSAQTKPSCRTPWDFKRSRVSPLIIRLPLSSYIQLTPHQLLVDYPNNFDCKYMSAILQLCILYRSRLLM